MQIKVYYLYFLVKTKMHNIILGVLVQYKFDPLQWVIRVDFDYNLLNWYNLGYHMGFQKLWEQP